jgi:hypothetical protein
MKNSYFVYAMDSRVVWVSDHIFQISILNDLYRVYKITDLNNRVPLDGCYFYTVKDFHKFDQENLIYSSPSDSDIQSLIIVHQKIKIYIHLCEVVNMALKSMYPPLLFSDKDLLDLVVRSSVDFEGLRSDEKCLHENFMKVLFDDKICEIKKRYLDFAKQIKNAETLEDLSTLSGRINFQTVNLV